MPIERLEYHDEDSFKYWEIRVVGSKTLVRFGRVGTSGQNIEKEHATPAAAQEAADKQLSERRRKGYATYSPHRVTPKMTPEQVAALKAPPKTPAAKTAGAKKTAPKKPAAKKAAKPAKR